MPNFCLTASAMISARIGKRKLSDLALRRGILFAFIFRRVSFSGMKWDFAGTTVGVASFISLKDEIFLKEVGFVNLSKILIQI